jgi:molybdopterin synthase catalytic subunit
MPFTLTEKTIDGAALTKSLQGESVGACVVFEGRVRDESGGRKVKALEYEAYDSLVEKEGEKILGEAGAKFAILRALCVHRTGKLGLGEIAVWIGVAAGHREAAFAACRYIIDETKARVPLWKKEHYVDGATEWINSASRQG